MAASLACPSPTRDHDPTGIAEPRCYDASRVGLDAEPQQRLTPCLSGRRGCHRGRELYAARLTTRPGAREKTYAVPIALISSGEPRNDQVRDNRANENGNGSN